MHLSGGHHGLLTAVGLLSTSESAMVPPGAGGAAEKAEKSAPGWALEDIAWDPGAVVLRRLARAPLRERG